ncbi:MAG: M15 family metallopeptidase [Bacilli bacterium]|nr:M15 family metallopeptidase [Bacilli bacterium]MDD4608471.1 M15 family metallopeptidase [Bacilli bacterium]
MNIQGYIYIIIIILIIIFVKEEDPINDTLILVNKENGLPSDYIPVDLELIDKKFAFDNKYLRHEARSNIEKLGSDALALGYKIIVVSAFRDYKYQYDLHNEYIKVKGAQYAELCSARPGYSEHQTGLAIDVMGSNNDYNLFEESIEFNWMRNNAHRYGFILRYPYDKTDITGYKYEPWHYRYVGLKTAEYIYKHNLTLEEYIKKQT